MGDLRYPNESNAYRDARDALLKDEQELVDKGKMTYKQYHDAAMSLNAMPIEMIRAILTKQPLDKDYTAKWRFYDNMTLN